MIKLAAALVTACVAIADPSYSASFDCHPIGSDKCPEAVICGSAAISSLDEQLASLYESLLEKISPARQEQLKDEQRLWIRGRNVCKCNASCIENQYRERVQQLAEASHIDRLTVGYDDEPPINGNTSREGCRAYLKEIKEIGLLGEGDDWGAQEVCAARRAHLEAHEKLQRSYAKLMMEMAFDKRLDRAVATDDFRTFIKSCIDHKFSLTTGGHNLQLVILPNKIAAACLDLGSNMLDYEASHLYQPW